MSARQEKQFIYHAVDFEHMAELMTFSYSELLSGNAPSSMAGAVRKARINEVSLSETKDDLSRFLREAEKQEIVITRHGKPAGVLIGFESEDDWFDYKLENDPIFLSASNRREKP